SKTFLISANVGTQRQDGKIAIRIMSRIMIMRGPGFGYPSAELLCALCDFIPQMGFDVLAACINVSVIFGEDGIERNPARFGDY
ncbi:MAG: hypothetical protein V2A34_04820, partial [Lentisphaerota bacterium]